MVRKMDRNNYTEDDVKWILAHHSIEVAKHTYGISVESSWNPLDMSGVPPTPPASALDENGQRYTIPREAEGVETEEVEEPYEEWSHEDLLEECKARELSTDGSDDDLAFRLMTYDAEQDAFVNEGEAGPIQPDYDAFKRSELQQILKQRGLPADGKNDELIARLQEDDAKRRQK